MLYKFFPQNNYEDFASGSVFYHNAGYTNYPVRLAGEIFSRCLEFSQKENNIKMYDPCCGSAYMFSVLGFLFNGIIDEVFCSDVSDEAAELSHKNLSLLSYSGIEKRKSELHDLMQKYNKESHKNALDSLKRIKEKIKHEIKTNIFTANILNTNELIHKDFIADIIMTDVPYGNLVNWSENTGNEIEKLLDGIIPVINNHSIIAISHSKNNKVHHEKYKTLEKIKTGHRKISILTLIN
jgi:hypothetical protein